MSPSCGRVSLCLYSVNHPGYRVIHGLSEKEDESRDPGLVISMDKRINRRTNVVVELREN